MSDADTELPDPVGPPVSTAPVEVLHQPPRWAPLTLVAFVALVIATNVANATWATLVDNDSPNPGLLLLLSSRNRYLAFALGADISVPVYAVVGMARIALAFAVCHLIGRAYSYQATGWFKKYLGFTDDAEKAFDRGFEKAEWALIPIFSGSNIVAVLTGVRRTPIPKLILLLSIGIAGRLALIWWLSRFFDDQLDSFLGFTTRYQWWVLGASVLSVVLINLKNVRR
ncbi:hypothetical protein [Ilumatobacter sp.]|uniref:hypothetical protein n=1 Tax=Ilumatobacter sp. TaxID=1967498 RepID=UPI003C64B8AA